MYMIISLEVHSFMKFTMMIILIFFGFGWRMHWVARTISTSLVPMPNAIVPNAPWVDVWLSPQLLVIPGRVYPSSGQLHGQYRFLDG